jgi:hypothetical protein
MKPLAHWPSKYTNEVEICGDTFYQIKRESETAMKRFVTLVDLDMMGGNRTHNFLIGTDSIGKCESTYYTITTTRFYFKVIQSQKI